MSEEQTNEEILEVAIDDIFSDTDLIATQRLFERHLDKPFDNLVETLHDEIVLPSIELINHRLNAENNPMYLAECLHDFLLAKNDEFLDENQAEVESPEDNAKKEHVEVREVLGYFVQMTDDLIKEHDHWHEKRCHVKSEIREKINNLRSLMESIGVYE